MCWGVREGEGRCGNGCREVVWGVGRDVGKCRGRCGKVCWGLGEKEEMWESVGGSVLGFPIPTTTSPPHPNAIPYTHP